MRKRFWYRGQWHSDPPDYEPANTVLLTALERWKRSPHRSKYEFRMARIRLDFICALKSPQLGMELEDAPTREQLAAGLPQHCFYDSHGW